LVDSHNGNLPAADTAVDVNVNHDESGDAVWLRDVAIEIRFPAVMNGSGSEELCWNEIIVTA
jgi:hypothetical protein